MVAELISPFVSVCFLSFSSHFGFIDFSFLVPHKRVLSVNSNYVLFLSLNQIFGYLTCFSLPSKQLWLWCWPRFTVLLVQNVVLCLGFLRMVYERTHSSVIVYSSKFARQFVINVKRQSVWIYLTLRKHILYLFEFDIGISVASVDYYREIILT